MGKRIRMGVVGGAFGASFFWHEHPDCVVEAVSDLLPERRAHLQAVYRCGKAYASLEQLIEDPDVDAVAVFSGAPDHVRHAVACLQAGKHVISAVPACMSIEEGERLLDAVTKTGLTYMMAETSWYHQAVISARQWFTQGLFGDIFYTEAEYHHPGLTPLFWDEEGKRTWRYGLPPMHYPTHCTAYLLGVTGERMTRVSCTGWGDDSPILKDNPYNNPFWNGAAFYTTERGHGFRVSVCWEIAAGGGERGQWFGNRMSFFNTTTNGQGPIIRRASEVEERDDAGFVRKLPQFEEYEQVQWWKTEMLPEPLRHDSGHDGSHTFLTHEFIEALVQRRAPAVDVRTALNLTVPGIVAHQSALKGGLQLDVPLY